MTGTGRPGAAVAVRTLVMERDLDAPRRTVFAAFTDADRLARWFAPRGYTVPRWSVDVEPHVGGCHRLTMVHDEDLGRVRRVEGTYIEVVENDVLTLTEQVILGDEAPLLLTLRVEFTDTGPGRSVVRIEQGPLSTDMVERAQQQWETSFHKLDDLLGALYPAR
ncbi:MAG TPA: SRPBCC domain-containing protein [Dermatophilaceae bacterium]|nr:SRPBCC domain-containing protein [Dermatophilaceae bacterium]